MGTVGRIKNPIMADRFIGEGKADFVCMGRAHIADPEIAEKARKGDIADILSVPGGLPGAASRVCSDTMRRGGTVNPRMGRESLIQGIQDEKRCSAKRVLVAGAGESVAWRRPEAQPLPDTGWCCARAGAGFGGQLRLAARMPKRQEIAGSFPGTRGSSASSVFKYA